MEGPPETLEVPPVATIGASNGPSEAATMPDFRRELYEKHLYDAHHAASRDYDQAILTLAAGTLALSVTFAHNITAEPAAGTREYLIGAWITLGVAIVAMVLSFLTSQWTLRDRITHVDDETPAPPSRAERATWGLNLAAGAGLVLGLALLGLYASANT